MQMQVALKCVLAIGGRGRVYVLELDRTAHVVRQVRLLRSNVGHVRAGAQGFTCFTERV